MSDSPSLARRLGLGRLLYRYFYRPREQLQLAGEYGAGLVWRAWRGESAMRRAAAGLPALPDSPPALTVPVCFLTGRHFLHQSLFCAHSFSTYSPCSPHYEFLSDGSLSPAHAASLRRIFPGATVSSATSLDVTVAAALPPERFPALHTLRKSFVLLRKLTDAMAGRRGYRLFFDSDMLFWSPPAELVSRAESHDPLYMTDTVENGYTATRAELQKKFGVPVATAVNSGLVGLHAEKIDWELMERAAAWLQECPGDQRLLEQTLWAVALGAQHARPLDAHAYTVVVDPPHWTSVRHAHPAPVLLHYAWRARLPYAAYEWRRYLAGLSS